MTKRQRDKATEIETGKQRETETKIKCSMRASQVAQRERICLTRQEMQVRLLRWLDLLEEEVTTHSSVLAWRIPWTEEPGGLQSVGSQRVRHD